MTKTNTMDARALVGETLRCTWVSTDADCVSSNATDAYSAGIVLDTE
ncbi:hypothetical protein OJ998_02390 [Solirubrobacter taibaiensis]|nr:hypothetical protein [Solirubrobacter taibaiensis]